MTEVKPEHKKKKKNQDVIWARVHGQTRPHDLLADWSQEEKKTKKKKQHMFTEKLKWKGEEGGEKKKTAHMGTEILTYKLNWLNYGMSHFCTVANPFEEVHEYTRMQ